MKSSIFMTAILSSTFLISTAFAADDSTTTSQSEAFTQLYSLSTQMLGHASMANDALMFGMYSEASDNINLAQKEAADLANQTAQFNALATNPSTTEAKANYLIPVMDKYLTVREVEGKRLASANPKVDVSGAETVHYKLFLDTKQASDAVNQAQSAISEQKYDDALNALQGINKGAILEATAYGTPLEAVRDNLMLAREEIRNKQYNSASYALSHAKHELARAEKKDSQLAKNDDVQNLQSQIKDMQTTLSQDNPSMLQKAENKIDGWIQTVETHLHSKS